MILRTSVARRAVRDHRASSGILDSAQAEDDTVIQRLKIENYRSIASATVEFRPFTLLVGANGSGKSNLLRLLHELADPSAPQRWTQNKHFNHRSESTSVEIVSDGGKVVRMLERRASPVPDALKSVRVFSIDPQRIGMQEPLAATPDVKPDGSGAIQVLDSLKTGDREDLFDKIESTLHEFVPEIQKLSFVPSTNVKRLQVREEHIAQPVLVSDLSEGTRLVLTILTIVFQERKPSIIAFEDLDRGIHPRLFGQVVEVCRSLVREPGAPQILATTHNPYLVDQFAGDEESVLVVEKIGSNTSFTKLSEKLQGLEDGDESPGGKWYAGLVGGVPERPLRHLPENARAAGR